jgi:NAD(P)-dependent dehydrogenase (short-subunit alcohol dehydrogenase family)
MITDLAGRVAVVTGGASGIGLALTERFVAEGMSVLVGDIERPRLEAEVARLKERGADVRGLLTDVSDAESVQRLADTAVAEFGAVHLLCNNAGVESGAAFLDIPLETWRWVMGVNFYGVLHGLRSFLPILEKQDAAHIVNTASLSALAAGAPTFGPYVSSKFAILGLSENLHAELAARESAVGISVLAPGPVKTQMTQSERNKPREVPSTADDAQRQELMARLSSMVDAVGLEPADIADMVVDAVHDDRFFVLPHPDKAFDAVRKRLRWMETNEPPGVRHAGD